MTSILSFRIFTGADAGSARQGQGATEVVAGRPVTRYQASLLAEHIPGRKGPACCSEPVLPFRILCLTVPSVNEPAVYKSKRPW